MYRPNSGSLADTRPFLDVDSTLRGLSQDFVTSFNTGNYDQVAALFAPDGAFMAPNHEPAYGPKPVERLLRQLGESGYEGLRLETIRIEHSADMAMEIARYSVAIRRPDGTTLADRGKCLKVWRRLGAWLIVADCWSSNLPVPAISPAGAKVA
jgi:ketosteroid isomerase-like protein